MGTSYVCSQDFGAIRSESSEHPPLADFFYPTFYANHPFYSKYYLRPCKAFRNRPGHRIRGFVKRGFIFLDVEVLDFEGVVADEVSSFFDIAAH